MNVLSFCPASVTRDREAFLRAICRRGQQELLDRLCKCLVVSSGFVPVLLLCCSDRICRYIYLLLLTSDPLILLLLKVLDGGALVRGQLAVAARTSVMVMDPVFKLLLLRICPSTAALDCSRSWINFVTFVHKLVGC